VPVGQMVRQRLGKHNGVPPARDVQGRLHPPQRAVSPAVPRNTDNPWVVASNTPDDRRGDHIAARIEVLAEVEVCTADWWVLSRAGCTVGEATIGRADNLIAGGRAKAASRRAPWGFTSPGDFCGIPETGLDGWRQRLIAELHPTIAIGRSGSSYSWEVRASPSSP